MVERDQLIGSLWAEKGEILLDHAEFTAPFFERFEIFLVALNRRCSGDSKTNRGQFIYPPRSSTT